MAANNAEDPTLVLGQNDAGKTTKEAGNPLEQIERLLTCPICLDRYKQPKLLACQHTFCLSCLENYVESTGGRPRLRCPECRAEHGLSLDGGVQSLQTNLTLLSFLEIHMEASAANAAEMQAYVQRYNLERCRVCEEKAELELCAHCEKKCCIECRRAHVDMLKRDLGRLLGQVRRLSARVKEASDGMGRGLEQVHANGEQTKAEIRDYFNRYQRELKRREENFLEQADVFVQNEERLMRTLRDALDVEWNNLQDACLWVDAALSGERPARDEDLARFKLEFQQGLDYLRSFQPDSEELFAKKLRFSPGDDAAKLPTAIANFGELTVSLPQFANRYLPLEQQYLPRPFRMSLESENYMRREQKASDRFGGSHRGDEEAGGGESAGAQRWRRRRELEEEAWARLRSDGGLRVLDAPWSSSTAASSRATSGAVSPLPTLEANRSPPAKSPVPMQIPPPQIEKAQQSTGIGANKSAIKKEETEKVEQQGIKTKAEEAKKVADEKVAKKEEEEVKIKKEEDKKEEEIANKKEEEKCQQKTQKPASIPSTKAPATTTAIPTTKTSSIPAPSSAQNATKQQQSNVPSAAQTSGQTSTAVPVAGRGATQMGIPPQAKGKPPAQIAATGIPTSTQQIGGGPKNAQAEGPTAPAATRGRLLMVNGPRGAAGTAAAAAGAPRRPGTTIHSHNQNQNLHHHNPPHPHQQSTSTATITQNATNTPKSSHQKPPLPVRQLSANGESTGKRGGGGKTANGPQKMNGKVAKKPADGEDEDEEEEEEEEEEVESGRRENGEEERQGRQQKQQQIQSQSTRFRIKCRSSSHGRPKPRPSIEIGQPIPVSFFPIKSTGEWPDPPASPSVLCRSRTNPDLAAELAVAQSPMLARRRPSQQEKQEEDTAQTNDFERMRPRPRLVIGDRGSALGQLNWPRGVCPLPDEQGEGDIFAVADSSNHRIQIFSAHEGSLLRSIGSFGTADGQFDGCCAVCVHKNRAELLVADRYNHRVQIFDLRGRFIRKFGSRGTGPGQFQHCWGIAVDEQLGLVYVADKDNHRVQMFDAEGEFLTKFGTMGEGARQFNHPLYLAFHSATRLLYVSDSANNRICVYSPDGCPVRQFQGRGPPEEQLKLPRGIALDEKGFLLVADSGNNRIQVFSPQGEWIRQFGSWGAAPGHFKGVEGICLLGGQLAIADRENNRIQLFSCSPNNPPK